MARPMALPWVREEMKKKRGRACLYVGQTVDQLGVSGLALLRSRMTKNPD